MIKRRIIKLSIVLLILGVIVIFCFYRLGIFFCLGKNILPERADLIFTMSSHDKERADIAAKVYKKLVTAKILVCKSSILEDLSILGITLYDGELQKMELINQKVPEKDIILKQTLTRSSYEDILCLKEYLDTHKDIKRIVIVTSPYHKRRVYYIANKVLKGKDIWVVSRDYDCSKWYERERDVLWVWNELAKFGWYLIRY